MEMNRSLRKYLLLWVGVIVCSVIVVVAYYAGFFVRHHKLAQDPTNIERITGLDLPDIASVESWDNLDRGTSCWDCFGHHSVFAEKLSDDCIRRLETLCRKDSVHWHKDEIGGCYEYIDDAWERGGIYCIYCCIYDDSSSIEYYVDEVEGVYVVLYGLPILLFAFVLVIWGIVLIIEFIIRKCKRRQIDND